MRRTKSTVIQLLEFVPVYLAFQCGRAIPLWLAHWTSWLLGGLIYYSLPRQRHVAVTNLRHVFGQTKSAREIKAIARQSCRSLIGSWFETIRLVALLGHREGRKTVFLSPRAPAVEAFAAFHYSFEVWTQSPKKEQESHNAIQDILPWTQPEEIKHAEDN